MCVPRPCRAMAGSHTWPLTQCTPGRLRQLPLAFNSLDVHPRLGRGGCDAHSGLEARCHPLATPTVPHVPTPGIPRMHTDTADYTASCLSI